MQLSLTDDMIMESYEVCQEKTMTTTYDNLSRTIHLPTAGTPADLHEGQFLNVMGPQDASGNVTATSIIIQPPGQGAPQAPPPGA